MLTIRGKATRWLGIVAPLGLGFLVAVTLAYQSYDAQREQRNAARQTAQDLADFAAYLLADVVDQRMSLAMLYAFYEEDRMHTRPGAESSGPGILRQEQELKRCEAIVRREDRFFFRYSFAGQGLEVIGPMPPDVRTWLLETLAKHDGTPTGRSFGHVIRSTAGRSDLIVAYRIREFRDPDRVYAYGFNSCFRDHEGNVFDRAQETTGVLPPALVGDYPADSLYTLLVLSGAGAAMQGDPAFEQGFVGSAVLAPTDAYDGMQLQLLLRPMAAAALLVGSYPASRLPLALAMVVLSAGLTILAIVQLRREQEVVRLRERFVGNVSHELRTPLQQILLYADLLQLGRVRTEHERSQAVEVINQEARRLVGLVENILQLSRRSNGKTNLRHDPLDLTELTQQTVSAFRPLAAQGVADIVIHARNAVTVSADANAVRQVLLNLLDNAVKYGPNGQHITVDLFEDGRYGCISVCDEGPGVPPGERDRIWDSFYRLEREEQAGMAGSGIGLTIVQQLVREMRGSVTIADSPPPGSTFIVRLPLATPSPPPAAS